MSTLKSNISVLVSLRGVMAGIVIAGTVLGASAETHYKPHVWIGGHAGMSISRMSFSPSVSQGWHDGIVMGVSARYSEEKIFGLIGELNFAQRGWKENFKDNPGLEYSRSLTYIELPIMTHIYFGTRRFKGFVNAGPQFAYMISENITSNFDYTKPAAAGIAATRHCDQMSMAVKNKFDYGIVAGIGCEFYVQPRHSISVEGRFYYGLGNLYGASKADTFSASRSMTLEITAGYHFRVR